MRGTSSLGNGPKAPGSYSRGAPTRHPTSVGKAEEAQFKAWARSFGPAVGEVLLTVDSDGWECQPARECYCRFGWWKGMPAKYILGWWMCSLRHLEEMEWWAAFEVYKSAIEDIKRAL